MRGNAVPEGERLVIGGSEISALVSALRRVIDGGGATARRLRYAATSVTFALLEDADDCATLLLDREPIQVLTGDDAAAVRVTFTRDQLASFTAGRLPMAAAIASGTVRASGAVRRYLEVDPILRALLAAQTGHAPDRVAFPGKLAGAGQLDPGLLAIETRGLKKSFGAQQVLNGLDLQIPEGVISVVLGPSGTGKSVLLQHVIGILRPDAGDVLIRGHSLAGMSRSQLLTLQRGIGVMFQDGALFSAMTIFENVAFPVRQHTDASEHEVRELVDHHLESVGLTSVAQRYPNELSGGMRKRGGLARALVLNPGIVVCDEPDSGLDPVRTALLGDLLIEQHAEHGGTMVVVTHNVALAKRIAGHVSLLWQGKVLESGFFSDILASDDPFIQQFLAGRARGPLGMDA